METFLSNATSFPTSVFTTINLVLIGIWFFMALGLLDIEVFDLDADVDIDADIDVDMDIDADASGMGGIASFLASLGLTGVPIFIVITIIFFTSWLLSYFTVKYGLFWNSFDSLRYLIGSGIMVLSFLVSIPLTAQFIKPLKKFFAKLNAETTSTSLLGKQCTVRSTRVTESFGEAECVNDGASLILKVRASEDYALARGDLVRIIEIDAQKSIFQVVPEKEFNTNNV